MDLRIVQTSEKVEMSPSNALKIMIKDILRSNLRPIEKLFLSIEWCLREQKPYEFYESRLIDVKRKAETVVENQLPLELRRAAFREGETIFEVKDHKKLLSLLTALSYYSYITNEFVHDQHAREELLSRIPELGFKSSEIQRMKNKWINTTGTPEELFNKIFRR